MQGDRLEVNVTNGLTELNGLDLVTTVVSCMILALHNSPLITIAIQHWHGIDQLRSNWADGVASVTQCPIIPGMPHFDVRLVRPLPSTQATHSFTTLLSPIKRTFTSLTLIVYRSG